MATSLLSPGTIKHVVPWKTRDEFLSVYRDLYSDEESLQERAIRRIAVWKSRVGGKLSVAIESSGALTQATLDHARTGKEGKLQSREALLRSSYSLALIRFVNHITEKGQTKATAQPVHLIAREFGIPEWIVRLRHDATHSALPCLDALTTGTKWALNFLKENFWNQQTVECQVDEKNVNTFLKSPTTTSIRQSFYDFQKVRYEELNASDGDKDNYSSKITDTIKVLQRYLTQNRLRFVKCLLEDGILVSTEEQLAAFGVSTDDLMSRSPPRIPLEITEFWRPLLKKVNSAGTLPFLIQTAMFCVNSGEGIRNYQLVAWVSYFLSQQSGAGKKSKRKRKRKLDTFKPVGSLPTKTLLSVCLQNLNGLTAHLLKYLADKESLGTENYNKLMKLLEVHSQVGSRDVSSEESDSDTVYTVEDIKLAREKHGSFQEITPNTVQNIQNSISGNNISWRICTDIVDWSTVPLGTLPNLAEDDDDNDDDNGDIIQDASADSTSKSKCRDSSQSSSDSDDDYIASRRKGSSKRRNIDNENTDNSGSGISSPKYSQLIVDDSRLM